ncbi:glycosyltransferase family 87 protein [Tunturiibacter psychrotolerans]|uniref:glycosyltransferase family 87 protein n=1 Tax=Tunturiibacter psychrotolerans TaxID=3069686 RepID=UPI003D1F7E14
MIDASVAGVIKLRSRLQVAAFVFCAFCCVFFVVKGFHDESITLKGFDFTPLYSGARCLLKHCDAYNSDQIRKTYVESGGDASNIKPFRPFNANYPPSALFLILPLATMPWGFALIIWLCVSAALFVVATLLVVDLCNVDTTGIAVFLLGLFVASSTILMMLAQPAGPAIGFCVIAVWCLIKKKFPVIYVVCFALSLTLKPHLGGLIWLYFFLNGGMARRRMAQVLIVTLIMCSAGMTWAWLTPQMTNWPKELRENLIGIAAHGNASDPGPANDEASAITDLQAAISVIRDNRALYNPVSFVVTGGLILIWCFVSLWAPSSIKKDLFGIAAGVYLGFLPIYHRQYDTRLLLLAFPATALLLSEGGIGGVLAFLLSVATIIGTSHTYSHMVNTYAASRVAPMGRLETILLLRPLPVMLLLGGIFYLVCYTRVLDLKQRRLSRE